jgi:uncharacterized protein YndB with AHSA1/START domain
MKSIYKLVVETTINAPVKKVWQCWTEPEHITQWNNASPDWHTTKAENNLKVGGTFLSRMEAKDGSVGFDFIGKHTEVKKLERIVSTLGDGREMSVHFYEKGKKTWVVECFEIEKENTKELQYGGWLAILNNFKKHVEGHK